MSDTSGLDSVVREAAAARGLRDSADYALREFVSAGMSLHAALDLGAPQLYLASRMAVNVPGSIAVLVASGRVGEVLDGVLGASTPRQVYAGSEVHNALASGVGRLLVAGVDAGDIASFAPIGLLAVESVAGYHGQDVFDFAAAVGAVSESGIDAGILRDSLSRLADLAVEHARSEDRRRDEPAALDAMDIWSRGVATDAVGGAGKLVAAGVASIDQAAVMDSAALRAALDVGYKGLEPLVIVFDACGRDLEALAAQLASWPDYGQLVGRFLSAGVPVTDVFELDDYELNGLYRGFGLHWAEAAEVEALASHWDQMRVLARQAANESQISAQTRQAAKSLMSAPSPASRKVNVKAPVAPATQKSTPRASYGS